MQIKVAQGAKPVSTIMFASVRKPVFMR
ncbi:hypothetical protein B4N90_08135 [Acinetobacter baumannii]|nr:hypothetical protein B4N90_08135 [Acinetobacter baumannii]